MVETTNFNFSCAQSYNAANIPMSLSIASPNFGFTDSGIKKQIIVSSQRSYFDKKYANRTGILVPKSI